MRYGTDYRFWVVTGPTPHSELIDILNPTLFSVKSEAEREARKRLRARRLDDES